MRKIYFRADAGANIGYGHFVRTLALADMLNDNFDCTFFTQTPTNYQRTEVAKVCKLVDLPSDDSKFDLFLNYLTGEEIVVLDNYFFTTDYQRQIKIRGCKLVCIDDIHDKHYVADVVINHGVVNSFDFDTESYTRLCLGFDWLLLRKPFIELIEKENYKARTNKVVFAFGASDMYNLTDYVANILNENNIQSIGIIGDGFKHRTKKYKNVRFFKNISDRDVADLFSLSEYAILPASSMCLEAISCGTKLLTGYFVDNQKEFARYMTNNGYAYDLGNMSLVSFENKLREVLFQIENSNISITPLIFPKGTQDRFINLFHAL